MSLPQMDITVTAIKQEAQTRTNLHDFGRPFFAEPLQAWVNDLQKPLLNSFGYSFLRRLAVSNLQRRLRLIDYLKQYPEILNTPIPPILMIAGFARTGTTLLHNLIYQHAAARAPLRWELMEPLPAPEQTSYRSDPRIAKVQASIEPLRGTLLEKMHWVNADEPEECPWGYYDCTGLLGRGCWAVMPEWSDWVTQNDLSSTFQEYRHLLQILLWKNPPPPNGFLVLKSPATTAQIDQFARVFPEARFLFTHRDPYRALISTCTVMDAICQPFTADGQRPLSRDGQEGQRVFRFERQIFKQMVLFAQTNAHQVANVLYADLMADPVTSCMTALTQLGISVPEGFQEQVSAYLDRQRQGHRAKPPQAYDTYGYDNDEVWSHPDTAEYCDFFGLQRESVRLTDVKTI